MNLKLKMPSSEGINIQYENISKMISKPVVQILEDSSVISNAK